MKWKTGVACLMFILFFAFPAWCDEPRDISEINQKMSFDLTNASVRKILPIFEEAAGLDIVFDESVQGRITIQATNVPLATCLEWLY